MAIQLETIKDPKLRKRLGDADAEQNAKKPKPQGLSLAELKRYTEQKPKKITKRVRQSAKPLMNKLEAEFYARIKNEYPNYPEVRLQAKRYRLGNGIWYKPDFTCSAYPVTVGEIGPARETAWEVKGPHAFRGGFENLKVAAATFPEVRWILVWKENGQWKQQEVLP